MISATTIEVAVTKPTCRAGRELFKPIVGFLIGHSAD
jgi:hypothetical protein